jgi:hypothetical protein
MLLTLDAALQFALLLVILCILLCSWGFLEKPWTKEMFPSQVKQSTGNLNKIMLSNKG